MVKRSFNAVVERNIEWKGAFATEPYEAGWSREALFFVTVLKGSCSGKARVQVSADGLRWCDEGTTLELPKTEGATAFCKVAHYGSWLRLAGISDGAGSVLVTLSLKE